MPALAFFVSAIMDTRQPIGTKHVSVAVRSHKLYWAISYAPDDLMVVIDCILRACLEGLITDTEAIGLIADVQDHCWQRSEDDQF